MKLILAILFTVLCKPGKIEEYDGSFMELSGDKRTYYYYDIEYGDGVYLYTTVFRDSVWFSVVDKEVYYDLDNSSNEEFEIQK